MKRFLRPLGPVFALVLLLARPDLSFQGALDGLLLWYRVVLPTLLPFLLCSSLLISWGGVPYLLAPLRPLTSRLGLSADGAYALLAGLLCGYPMGARTTADLMRRGAISGREGRFLLAACACPSPMFLTGYIQPRLDPSDSFSLFLTAIYLPLILIGLILRPAGRRFADPESAGAGPLSFQTDGETPPFDLVLMDCLELMARIGGYLMLYSVLAAYAAGLLPELLRGPVCGLFEMTTGIRQIAETWDGAPQAALIAACAAFGGLSGVSQTNAVIKNAGLSIRHYVFWKLIHAGLALLILILPSCCPGPAVPPVPAL